MVDLNGVSYPVIAVASPRKPDEWELSVQLLKSDDRAQPSTRAFSFKAPCEKLLIFELPPDLAGLAIEGITERLVVDGTLKSEAAISIDIAAARGNLLDSRKQQVVTSSSARAARAAVFG